MVDTVDIQIRSRMMAAVRGVDTKPEVLLRKALHARGYRYRLHSKKLPGKPDIVFPMYSAVIFVNGCFWHGHDCPMFRMPKSNVNFWQDKITKNKERDLVVIEKLLSMGWRIGILWECALLGKTRMNFDDLLRLTEKWLHSSDSQLTIQGAPLIQKDL